MRISQGDGVRRETNTKCETQRGIKWETKAQEEATDGRRELKIGRGVRDGRAKEWEGEAEGHRARKFSLIFESWDQRRWNTLQNSIKIHPASRKLPVIIQEMACMLSLFAVCACARVRAGSKSKLGISTAGQRGALCRSCAIWPEVWPIVFPAIKQGVHCSFPFELNKYWGKMCSEVFPVCPRVTENSTSSLRTALQSLDRLSIPHFLQTDPINWIHNGKCSPQGLSFGQMWEQTATCLTVECTVNLHNKIPAWQFAVSSSSVFINTLLLRLFSGTAPEILELLTRPISKYQLIVADFSSIKYFQFWQPAEKCWRNDTNCWCFKIHVYTHFSVPRRTDRQTGKFDLPSVTLHKRTVCTEKTSRYHCKLSKRRHDQSEWK